MKTHSPSSAQRLLREDRECIDLIMSVPGILDDPALARFKMAIVNLQMELEAEKTRSSILAKALCTYGTHHNGDQGEVPCENYEKGTDNCTCGLDPTFHVAKYVDYDAAVNYFLSYSWAKELPKKD